MLTALSMLSYDFYDSPLGTLLLVAGRAGLIKIAFENEEPEKVLANISLLTGEIPGQNSHRFADIFFQLDQYFLGKRTSFTVEFNYNLTHGFRKKVLQHLALIPYGVTISYGQLAQLCQNPRAARAVGSACATNPLPIIIPCHRVIRSDGTLGGYGGCRVKKEILLRLEDQVLKNSETEGRKGWKNHC